ncbi:MAG: hypothetical protein ACXVCP_19510, partial [Bdellovibrio sp.]
MNFSSVKSFLSLSSIIIFLLVPIDLKAATRASISCSFQDVSSTVAGAIAGDTVTIPSGKCTWNQTLEITKPINLIGAGPSLSVITADNVVAVRVSVPNGDLRISNLGFTGSGGGTGLETAVVQLSGVGGVGIFNSLRMDHCSFTNIPEHAVIVGEYWDLPSHPKILFDHINLSSTVSSRFAKFAGQNNTWKLPDLYGTDFAIFIEDSAFTWTGVVGDVMDTEHGVRMVIRHNTITNGDIQMHDTGSTPAAKGERATEIYNNTISCNIAACSNLPAMGLRGGGYIVHDNVVSSGGFFSIAWPQIWRATVGSGYLGGACNGASVSACNTNNFQHCSGGDHRECDGNWDCVGAASGSCVVSCTSDTECPSGIKCLAKVDNVNGGNDSSGWPCRNQTGWGMESADGSTEEPSPVYWYRNLDQNGNVYSLSEVTNYFILNRDFCYHDPST